MTIIYLFIHSLIRSFSCSVNTQTHAHTQTGTHGHTHVHTHTSQAHTHTGTYTACVTENAGAGAGLGEANGLVLGRVFMSHPALCRCCPDRVPGCGTPQNPGSRGGRGTTVEGVASEFMGHVGSLSFAAYWLWTGDHRSCTRGTRTSEGLNPGRGRPGRPNSPASCDKLFSRHGCTNTHIHRHTQAHIHMHTYMHTQVHTGKQTHVYIHMHTYRHTYMHTHAHIQAHTGIHTNTCIHTHKAQSHTNTHVL